MFRLAYFVSHPIQYQAPLLRLISADPDIDLTVFFYSDFSLRAYKDEEFGCTVEWDVPLTEGYKHQFLSCWGSPLWKGWLHQPVAKDIKSLIRKGDFDGVWVHGWSWLCSLQAVLSASRLRVPVLLRGEANGSSESPNFLKLAAKRVILSWLFKRISSFLPIGTLNYDFYRSYGVSSSQLSLVPYAVDNRYFEFRVAEAKQERGKLCESLEIDPDRPIILYASKITERKRPQDLLDAYYRLAKDSERAIEPYLLFVGDGDQRTILEEMNKTSGCSSVRFLGFQNQSALPAFYDLCDVFVLPSSFEPWGLAINEVMNAGKALVVSDQVGCRHDLVEDGVNGRVFPARNIGALSEALAWAIDNASDAGAASLQKIRKWSYQEDLQGIKQALLSLPQKEN